MSRTRKPIDILNHDLLGPFVADLIDGGMASRDVCYMLGKPWKWQPEFILFVCRTRDENRNGNVPSSYQRAAAILDAAAVAKSIAIDAARGQAASLRMAAEEYQRLKGGA